ncbi:hypothetical protein [Nostoc sp.]|uniref:hypothetical protein n=1 Tax=Nostoc sp. TaxID=1180 RepID=UPI002FF98E5A
MPATMPQWSISCTLISNDHVMLQKYNVLRSPPERAGTPSHLRNVGIIGLNSE